MLAHQATARQQPAKIVPITRAPRFMFGGDAMTAGYKALAAALVRETLADLVRHPAGCDADELERKADAYAFVTDEESALCHYVACLQLSPENEEVLWHRLFEAQAAAEKWFLSYRRVLPLRPAVAAPAARA